MGSLYLKKKKGNFFKYKEQRRKVYKEYKKSRGFK